MRVSTRLVLSGLFILGVVSVLAAELVTTTRAVKQELIKNETANELLNAVSGIRYLTLEYLSHHEARPRLQWQLRHASLSALLSGDNPRSRHVDADILSALRQSHGTVNTLFTHLLQQQRADAAPGALTAEVDARLTAQIVVRLERMIADTLTLAERSRSGVLRAQRSASQAVVSVIVLMLLTVAATTYVTVQSVSAPLRRLREGAAIVGAGDLSFRLPVAGRDELGELAEAFNCMTAQLRDREARLRRLVDSSIIGVTFTDGDGTVVEANSAFLQLLQHERADVASGRLDWQSLSASEPTLDEAHAERELARAGVCAPFERELLRKDGQRVSVLVGMAHISEADEGRVAFVLDLTQRKRAEQEREAAQAELRRVVRAATLGELTASIAHEINQPLCAIANNASAGMRWLRADNLEEARRSAALVIEDSHRASQIIARIRAMVRNAPPLTEALDLNAELEAAVAMTRGEAVRQRVELQTQLASALPRVQADRIQIQQVVVNLIVNAIEAMRDASLPAGARKVLLRSEPEPGGGVRVSVCDAGSGLPATASERIFEAFYTTKRDGLGMGLAVSRSIVEAHRGRLWFTPNAARGVTFQLSLPSDPGRSAP